jgi:hypothetical protein
VVFAAIIAPSPIVTPAIIVALYQSNIITNDNIPLFGYSLPFIASCQPFPNIENG